MVAAIAGDLQKQPDHRVKGMRYFVLTNLYNSCATDEALDVYRQGIVKLLNGFGRRSDVVRLVTVDPERDDRRDQPPGHGLGADATGTRFSRTIPMP